MTNLSKISTVLITGAIICGCVKNSIPAGPDTKPLNMFNYATVQDCSVEVNYNLPKGYDIVFSIYAEDPLDENGIEKNNVSAVFKAMTSEGKFTTAATDAIVRLPTYVKQVYLCSNNIGVENRIVVPVINQTIKMDTKTFAAGTKSVFSTRASSAVVSSGLKPLGTWNEKGIPDYLLQPATLSADLLKDIDYCFNRVKRKVTQIYPQFFADGVVLDANIIKPTGLEITYITTSAGFNSTFAYFTYKKGNKPAKIEDITTRIVAIPCTIGALKNGDKIKLQYWNGTAFVDEFPAGVSVGWILLGNAYKQDNSVQELANITHYSISEFNKEKENANKQHVAQLYSSREKVYFLAFEDQSREGERANNDFADCHLLLRSTVDGAIDNSGVVDLVEWKDSDGDGVHDSEDEFPNDPGVAFTIHYPAGAAYGTLAFEDLWPSKGDYDMNDMVVTYHSTHFVNKNSFIKRVKDDFSIIHSGAGLRNGFGYQYGVTKNQITNVTRTTDYAENNTSPFLLDEKGFEKNQELATMILCKDVNEALKGKDKVNFTIEVEFGVPKKPNELSLPPYNPFIVIQSGDGISRGKEVHLPGCKPTSLADMSLFGTGDDKSDPAKQLFYCSLEQFPFALHIPDQFSYPAEKQRIDHAYPLFVPWVTSGGTESEGWYKEK